MTRPMLSRRRLFAALPGSAALLVTAGMLLTPATAALAQSETAAPEPAADATASGYTEHYLGDPNAPVEILEFSSFTCSHCAAFHTDHLPVLKERYIDTGKAKLRIVDFPLDNIAGAVSLITRCAPDSMYQKLVEIFFSDQSAWMTRNPREAITGIARLGGMSKDDVDACLENEALYTEIRNRQAAADEKWDISGTPTFVINGKKHEGSYSAEAMSEAIEAALAEAGG
ncbi:thioredoxin domain-containing protein [Roseospira marina]|uniref:thioredoxin domain-containing protein n=1 Tax=Roseospira marina TaxID=140057 RepID=UPI00147906DC|nr:thioredoxin domain-containing protein [Roseospira marina]MBB4314306.1 protein-disulfide isomerase [Roseospira marina]MBB5087466.1 protein-disulfide isomerase [Roseospira marina]